MFKKNISLLALAVISACVSSTASAYYLIYSPTVEYGETEIELYGQIISDDNVAVDGAQQYVLEVAKGITPKLMLEAKVEVEKAPHADLQTEAVSIEGVYQLTEQGEASWNVGLLGEIEYSVAHHELAEVAFGPLLSTDFGSNMTFTTNILAEYEYELKKVEGSINAQLKWRLGRSFEPAIEVYANESRKVMGPVVMGKIKAGSVKIGYQLGWLLGMDKASADNTFKFMAEYEF